MSRWLLALWLVTLIARPMPAAASRQTDTETAKKDAAADELDPTSKRQRIAIVVGASGASFLIGGLLITGLGMVKTATDDCAVDDCDTTPDMFRYGASAMVIGSVLGVAALVLANTGAETRLDDTATGAVPRARVVGNVWLSPQGLHF